MAQFKANLSGVTFLSKGKLLIGGFYKANGETPRPTAILLHGLPGIEKHLDIAYRLRDLGWNCLYFHFRGCWGSQGSYSLDGLADDTNAAIDWVMTQPCVDKDKIVLIAGSTGSYPALIHGAIDRRVKAIAGISPVIVPAAFKFPVDMAGNFARMLTGITGEQIIIQWNKLPSLKEAIQKFSPLPILLIAAGDDDIFPLSHYLSIVNSFPNIDVIEKEGADHGFSDCRTWLVGTVADWLMKKIG